ncbi:3-isopropylmalate dehydratase large subunit [Candidimonas nitroreducens]|uniref:3-isopropylmalate dehydratase n=1 Tax=Candidimonas nitroreducens TaxID=683354 RepID=A0A225MBV9_9BURK|nr:aconitase family protein [Candidimonas nitroreducens]OWT57630.1 3-isopropylmalate dehydratase [Candidimonas nitroreducens]
MGFTAVEKVLGRASGRPGVRAGDVVYPNPDRVVIHDVVVRENKEKLDQIGITRLTAAKKVMMVTDHDVVYGNQRAADRGAFNRKAAAQWGVGKFYDAGQGGHGHIFPIEQGLLLPGMFYFDNDFHAANSGAVGAFGLRAGAEISRVLATGTTWVEVPKTVLLEISGQLKSGVQARDVGFYLARCIKSGVIPMDLDYRVLEYAGELDQFGLGARVALCSTPVELRAAGIFIPPGEEVLAYCRRHAKMDFTPVFSDADADYEARYQMDVSAIEPQVALPGAVSNSVDVSEVVGTPVDHAFIGSCGSGMYEDLLCAASLIKGRHVAPGVRLFIVPGSERSTQRMAEDGLAKIFLDAGAMILPAGCGPCNDAVVGPVAAGEVSISTATNNNVGRFGSRKAKLFLGSPMTVAASAVLGKIADSRELSFDTALQKQMETAYV